MEILTAKESRQIALDVRLQKEKQRLIEAENMENLSVVAENIKFARDGGDLEMAVYADRGDFDLRPNLTDWVLSKLESVGYDIIYSGDGVPEKIVW